MKTSRLAFCLPLALMGALACANTKGLNQVVTPDVQPLGQLSVSFQLQHPFLGNPEEAQYELGVTKQLEFAVFQGLKPGIDSLSAELGLIQKGDWLLSTGFLGWDGVGDRPVPFLEGGYYKGPYRYIAGVQQATNSQNQAILGIGYQASSQLFLESDYLSGSENFTTLGFTYSPTPALSINPALYMANSSGHKIYPYLVVSFTMTAFKG